VHVLLVDVGSAIHFMLQLHHQDPDINDLACFHAYV
jgi:hypothetical protein